MLHNVLQDVKSKQKLRTILANQHQSYRLDNGAVLVAGTPEHQGFIEGLKLAAQIVGDGPQPGESRQ